MRGEMVSRREEGLFTDAAAHHRQQWPKATADISPAADQVTIPGKTSNVPTAVELEQRAGK